MKGLIIVLISLVMSVGATIWSRPEIEAIFGYEWYWMPLIGGMIFTIILLCCYVSTFLLDFFDMRNDWKKK